MQYTYKASRRNMPGDEEDQQEVKFPMVEIDKKPYRHFEQTYTAQQAHFYISKTIGEAEHYVDMIHRISVAGPTDTIYIHLNTPGGHLDTGVQIINAMQNSQAKVVTVLEGVAYSLGTLIFLAGDEMVVNDHCMMMFHNFNSGLIGKGNELVAELEATVSWFNSLAKDIYIPFLTDDEYERIARGEDKWMQSAEIRTRLEVMVKKMNDEAAELQKAEQAIADAIEAALTQPKPATKKAPTKKTPTRKA